MVCGISRSGTGYFGDDTTAVGARPVDVDRFGLHAQFEHRRRSAR